MASAFIQKLLNKEQTSRLSGGVTYGADDLIADNSLTSAEKQQILQNNLIAENKRLDNELRKDKARIRLGATIQGASLHPIFNIPYIGTGIGGAMFDMGGAIMQGDKLPDIAKKTGQGFVIGETVGTIPYVGRVAGKTKAGQTIEKNVSRGLEAFNNTGLGQKIRQGLARAEDILMADIRGLNPNKQIVYQGSPYNFNKFSDKAIGSGHGGRNHGKGHYTVLDKDIAEKLYNKGQVYKLSVPKDDVMIRENMLLSEQPINLLDIYNEMAQKNPEKYKNLPYNKLTGRDLYVQLEKDLGSDNAATEYLLKKGIKGISFKHNPLGKNLNNYEGRLIFNPDDIDIIRKYYNRPKFSDLMNKRVNMGAFANALLGGHE